MSLTNDDRRIIRNIAATHGAVDVRVFGSTARGEASAQSDLDLLIRLPPGHDLLDLIGIKQDIESALGRSVDVVTDSSLSPYLRDRVLGEAVPL